MVPSALYFFDGRCTSGCYPRSTTANSACSHGVQHLHVWPRAGHVQELLWVSRWLEWPRQAEEIHPRVLDKEREEGLEEAQLITANPGWTRWSVEGPWSVEGRVPAAAPCPLLYQRVFQDCLQERAVSLRVQPTLDFTGHTQFIHFK